ncbi:hypothetical protein TcBrA4_0006210 [Trypanosoma cruzi]|nr:hypothetical protein TcBrA4_0006210 [Trypanosoma cruzi]
MPVRGLRDAASRGRTGRDGGRAGAAGDAGVHGNASRRVVGGAALLRVLRAPCSRRLRSATHSRTIVFYWRGVGAGKWHFFAEEIVGTGRCFLYTLRDYAETRDLEVHVAFSELRCCVKDEDARAVRQADGSVGGATAGASSPEGRLASLV